MYAFDAGARAIKAHYDRIGVPVEIKKGEYLGLYRNSELLKLYPWLVSTEESLQYAKRRNSPYRKNRLIIPVEQIEKIMCQALRKIYQGDISIEEALKAAQEEADHLFSMYGYPTIHEIFRR